MKNSFLKEIITKMMTSYHFVFVYLMFFTAITYIFVDTSFLQGTIYAYYSNLTSSYMLFLFLMICISTLVIVSEYNSFSLIIQRFKNKKEYIKNLLYVIIIINTILLLSCLFIAFLITGLRTAFDFRSYEYFYYGISLVDYVIFYVGKTYCILLVLSCIVTLLLQVLPKLVVGLGFLLVSMSLFGGNYVDVGVISSLQNIPLMVHQYFEIYQFSSFYFEILCTSIYTMGLVVSAEFIFYILQKKHIEVR